MAAKYPVLSFASAPCSNKSGNKSKSYSLSGVFHWPSTLLLFIFATLLGCGASGYPGGGLQQLSASSVALDAGQSYRVTATVTGNLPVTWTMSGPASCASESCGSLSASTGTSIMYTAPAVLTSPMQVTLTAAISGTSSKSTVAVTVNPDPTLTGNLGQATIGVPYRATLSASGGTSPLTLSVTTSQLPPGLSFDASAGVISGTPTTPGNYVFSAQVADSSAVPNTITTQFAIRSSTPVTPLLIVGGVPPSGTVSTAYSYTLQATGGVMPYTWSIVGGALPPGLSLAPATGTISGTPTTQGTFLFTAQVQDAQGTKASAPFSITINPSGALTITVTSLPNGTVNVAYNQAIGVSGGTAPYSCTTPTPLQAGLTLTASGCIVSGTPTASGTGILIVTATDSSVPAKTTTAPVSLTIAPAGSTLTITSPQNAIVGVPYVGTIGVSGGTAPYGCAITGALPAGLVAANCTITGVPLAPGSTTVTVKATDSRNPPDTGTGPATITVVTPPLTITTSMLLSGTVNIPYIQPIVVLGGTPPYSCTIVSGTLQAGLTLTANDCIVSGTPTVAGTVNLTVKATDSSNPTRSITGPVSLTINPALVTLTLTPPLNGVVNVPYVGTIGVSAGTGPYTCSITAGVLPTGLTINNCIISGTATVAGTVTLTVKATDSSSPSATVTGQVSFTIAAAIGTLTLSPPPTATVQTPYTGTIGVSGGTPPYTCSIPVGTLPPGLSNTSCVITGTPTVAGTTTVTVTATDSSNPKLTTTGPVPITVQPVQTLTLNGSLPNATVNVAYTQTLTASGGIAPYTYAVTTSALPAGLSLNANTGVISGTPTTPGATSFTVTATDSENPAETASLPLTLLVTYAVTPNDAELTGPYAFLFQGYDDVTAGVFAYQTATVGSFTANGAGLVNTGEQDANHESANPTGNTVPTYSLLGTYTIGTDNRGLLTLTTLNPDGTTASTATYAISIKAPVAPATTSKQGSLIEADGNQLVGTKGSGTFLAQTASTFTTGLTGSFVFGMSGDTPCLPTCAVNVSPGPAAAVGEFTANGGAITGTGDSGIATATLSGAALSGSYGVADANGRVQVSMTTAGEPIGVYPTDYALYMVDGTQAFLLSTDKHSAYILLAGSTQVQTQASYTNAQMTGAFVGYENTATNPGLVTSALSNTLGLSTATIFQATDTGNGTCSINAVNTGGVDSLTTALTGLGGSATGLTAALGAYDYTGSTTCPVTSIGRGTLQYPQLLNLGIPIGTPPAPRVFYLSAPNRGYFLETSYAGLGNFEPQTGGPFTEANTFTGTYVYASTPAASLASIDTSGYIKSNGAGSASYTVDQNTGVGTLNVIQLGVTGNGTYTAPDAYGRIFFNGTTVIYALTPNKFVLLDTNKLTTSPSVSLLY